MAGQKCFTCNHVFKELDQFNTEDDWEDKPHDDIHVCVKVLGQKVSQLYELLNIVEGRFAYDKVMRRKEIV